ncbi:hypothetical protein TRFO_40955 [Tritrichomonas foetus]|uniref:Uncharacterized protein n=1 Tax=Tritrichomonas foetus TaxID=1144522 RepID=A0A1J4J4X9_9EUKA|nr:hypothetical protein TRFO_40955 [Tritrichomonas foetus]|eukprot:OHS92715.1 hypothetical protein TRFO_40955 [Tritrichomonas foetus]
MDISKKLLPNGKLDFNLKKKDTSFSLFTILNKKIKKNDPLLNGTIKKQLLERLILMRKKKNFTPLTPDISEFKKIVMNLTLSKNEIKKHQCTNFTISVWEKNLPLYMKLCLNIVEHASTISNESFFKKKFNPCLLFSMSNNHVASKILFDLICKLEVDRSDLLTQLKSFLSALAFKVIPFDCPNNNDKNYINLLSKKKKMISQNNNYTKKKIFNISVIYIIY